MGNKRAIYSFNKLLRGVAVRAGDTTRIYKGVVSSIQAGDRSGSKVACIEEGGGVLFKLGKDRVRGVLAIRGNKWSGR